MHKSCAVKGMLTALIVSAVFGTYAQNASAVERKCAAATPKSCIGISHSWDPYPGWWEDRHAKKLAQIAASGGKIDIVFIGDSITHNWEGARGPGSDYGGKPLAELKKKYSVLNLGFGGDATQNVLWRLENGELDGYVAKCIVLMIGTNNGGKPEDTATGIKAILDVITAKQPLAMVVLHPIFPSGATTGHAWRVRNSKVNGLIRPFADGKRVVWCDFNDRFLNPDGTLKKELMKSDDLHPAPPAYDIWAEQLMPIFRKACADKGEAISPWRVRKDADGYWTFVDPKGNDVFIRGVEQVVWRGHGAPDGHIPAYRTHNIATFPNRKAWADDAEAKLRKWGFNTLGSWSDDTLRGRGFGHFVHVGFAWPPLFMADEDRDLMIVRKTGRFFPNVFSPRWVYHCKTLAKARLIMQGSDFDLIGIYLDGELPWWGENGCPDREVGLCDVICAQPAGHTARKAYDEFMAARADGGSRAAKLDFMRLIAEKYFATTTDAIRRIDKRHMIMGCMFAGLRGYGPFSTMEACAKYCDVVTIDIYPPVDLERGVVLRAGTDLADVKGDLTDKELFREIDRIGKIINKPFHVTEWSFPAVEGGFPCVAGGGMRFRTQHERAMASRLFAEMMNASPSIAGYNYFMWVDGQNRPTGKGYCNYGLMNEAGEPYAELVRMFEDFHAGADAARKKGYPAKRRWVDPLGPVVPASSFAERTIVGADGKGMLESFDFKDVTLIMKLRATETRDKWEWRKFSFEKPVAEDKKGNAICRTYRFGSPRGRIRFEATLRNWFRDDTHEALTEVVSIENKGEPFEMGSIYWRFTPPKPLATRVCAMPPSWCTWRPWVDLSIPWGERTLRILSPENSVYGDTRPGTGEGFVPPELGYVISHTIASGETWRPKDAAYYIFRFEDHVK